MEWQGEHRLVGGAEAVNMITVEISSGSGSKENPLRNSGGATKVRSAMNFAASVEWFLNFVAEISCIYFLETRNV